MLVAIVGDLFLIPLHSWYSIVDSIYVCAGLSGHGFKLSPAYGKIGSEMVTKVKPEKAMFDWRPFNKERYASGKLIPSLYSEVGTIYSNFSSGALFLLEHKVKKQPSPACLHCVLLCIQHYFRKPQT